MLCPGCFQEKPAAAVCPHCGYDESLKRSPLVLPHLMRLNTGRYRVGRVLGKPGGFGITYLGWDERLQTKVAIKEYLPRDLAGRDADHLTVAAHSGEDADAFAFGLGKFLEEARTLAKLDHPNLVRVRDFFEENGTAYLVMDYYDGLTLAEYLTRQPGSKLPEDQAIGILLPILDGLREVHAKGFLHRDIKPANIYLTAGNRPILLDFGAARQAMGEHSRSLSVVLSEGYAPIEQYQRNGKQGPWTDVYGAAATLYTMLTGQVPPSATDRIGEDSLPGLGGLSPPATRAIAQGMAHAPDRRPATLEQWQRGLLMDQEAWSAANLRSRTADEYKHSSQPERPPPGPISAVRLRRWNPKFLAIGALMGTVTVAGFGLWAYLDVSPEMVRLPGGSFLMGSPLDELDRDADESQHRVTVSAFAIGRYEVTQAEWRAVMGDNPSYFKGCDRCPVEQVSWHDVQTYIEKLNARSGRRYRLPTEEEWEYACRAGESQTYCGADSPDPVAWYGENSGGKTHPVGQKPSNAFGLYDMSGNVWEWTGSCPEGECARRVYRGGSWYNEPGVVRSANRGRIDPTYRVLTLGFRLAQD